MHNFRATSIAAVAAFVLAFAAPAAHASTMGELAPADHYFGRLKMSILGIRNELDTLERRVMTGDHDLPSMIGKLAFVDDALRDWRVHYPRDNWLPRYEAKRARIAAMLGAPAAQP